MDKDLIDEGMFYIPHIIFEEEFDLKKSDILLILAFFKLEDYFLSIKRGIDKGHWFNTNDKELRKLTKLSKNTITKSRERLVDKKLISFNRGHTKVNSNYRISLDKFYLNQKHFNPKK